MKCSLILLSTLASFSAFAADYSPERYKDLPDWENPYMIGENKLPNRTVFTVCKDPQAAIAISKLEKTRETSSYIQMLNGKWSFSWAKRPEERVVDFYKSDYDVSKWNTIQVPGCWQLQGDYDPPIYLNTRYPHVTKPPFIMLDPPKHYTAFHYRNPVGSYRRTFTVPTDWASRRTILHFEGVASAMYVWVNGQKVGYSEDSRLPAAFDISTFLQSGENTLAVEVYRWSDGSYLECQDFWRLSGIFRDVWLASEGKSALEDYTITTSFDEKFEDATLRVKTKVSGDASVKMSLLDPQGKEVTNWSEGDVAISKPLQWNAETPHLYTLLFTIEAGSTKEYVAEQVGFRQIDIKDAVIRINGKRILFKGVNRHEMHPETGYTVSLENMRNDIKVMKSLNINAVRTCHYPNATDWYRLCDIMGIYLVDEANIESHGMGYGKDSLAHRPDFLDAHISRCTNMILRDKNYPSIIFWSMGNEAGFGKNFVEAYNVMKKLDPTRPVQYERAGQAKETDIVCPMYAPPYWVEQYAKKNPYRPYILCEYAHAMGNSLGNFFKYWDLTEKYDCLQGGFIWDFADQSLFAVDKETGIKYLAFGGDFGDKPNDQNFCNNGLVDALRRPHPGAYEVKYIHQNIRVTTADWKQGIATVQNRFSFRDINAVTARWFVTANGKTVSTGTLDIANLPAGETRTIKLVGWKAVDDIRGEKFLNFTFNEPIFGTDTEIAKAQIAYSDTLQQMRMPTTRMRVKYTCDITPKTLTFKSHSRTLTFDQTTGYLTSCKSSGAELLNTPIVPTFWRAPIDNDRGNNFAKRHAVWKHAGRDAKLTSLTHTHKVEQGVWKITASYTIPAKASTATLVYTLMDNGQIKLDMTLVADKDLPTIPRVGVTFGIPKAYDTVTWFGRGPHENYNDRQMGAFVGEYTASVATLESLNTQTYTEPQEVGHRGEVRMLTFTNDKGGILRIGGTPTFGFNAWPHTLDQLEGPTHPFQMKLDPNTITVTLDIAKMGVGGDNSWGAQPHGEFQPKSGKTYTGTFIIAP